MNLIMALASFGVGLLATWAMFRRAKATLRRAGRAVNPSLEDWRAADPLQFDSWTGLLAATAAFVVVSVGINGFGAPARVRAALLGVLAGICLPPSMAWACGCGHDGPPRRPDVITPLCDTGLRLLLQARVVLGDPMVADRGGERVRGQSFCQASRDRH
jgi:hypothetical protein